VEYHNAKYIARNPQMRRNWRIKASSEFSSMTSLMEVIRLFSFGDLDGVTLLTEKVEQEAKVRGVY